MAIQKLDNFAEIGDKNLNGIDMQQGFIQAEKPARQWFNSLFNSTIKKVNEVITALESISIGTDKIADGAVTTTKLANVSVTGDKIAKNAALDTPILPNTYALTTLAAPNVSMDATGALTRSNDPLNAASRKVGTAVGNLVERGADGYPVSNNALGVGQTWQDLTASRTANTTYTNSSGKAIFVSVLITQSGSFISSIYIGANILASMQQMTTTGTQQLVAIIPPGVTYKVAGGNTITNWWELR